MPPTYDPNSVVDLLKSRGMASDIASRAKLAVDYGLATNPQDYYTKAQTGEVNTALIAKLKGAGGTTGSMQTTNAPVNASQSQNLPSGATAVPTTTKTPTPTGTSTSTDYLSSLGVAKPELQSDAELKAEAQAGLGYITPERDGYDYSVNGRKVYKAVSGDWIYSDTGEIAGKDESEDPLVKQKKAQEAQNEIYRSQELESTDLTIKQNRDLLYNSLAARGLLEEGATAGVEKLQEFENEAKEIRQKVQDKWNVANAGLSAKLSADIQARLDKELEKLRADQKARIDNYYTETKMIQEAKQQDIENALNQQQLELDRMYKEGQLTLGQYEAQTARLKANAEIGKLGAETAKLRAETGEIDGQKGAIKSETADMLSNIDSVLNNPLLGQVVGFKNPLTYWTPGSNEQQVKNQFGQIIASLSLENRKKLKGSGAISDFESKTLERASSALGKNLSNKAAEEELRKVRGALATANGLSANIQVKDPRTGQTQMVNANRDQINSIISDGLLVEYK